MRTAHSQTSTRTPADSPCDTSESFRGYVLDHSQKGRSPRGEAGAKPRGLQDRSRVHPHRTRRIYRLNQCNSLPRWTRSGGAVRFSGFLQSRSFERSCDLPAFHPEVSNIRFTANHVPRVEDPFSPEASDPMGLLRHGKPLWFHPVSEAPEGVSSSLESTLVHRPAGVNRK